MINYSGLGCVVPTREGIVVTTTSERGGTRKRRFSSWLAQHAPKRVAVLASLSLIASIPIAMATQTAASASTTVFAGNSDYGYNGDNIAATSASLEYPYGIAADASGNVYFADSNNSVIRKVDTGGTIHTILGLAQTARTVSNGGLNHPLGIAAADNGNLFIADTTNNAIWEKDSGGTVTQLAGSRVGSAGYGVDGSGYPLLSGPTAMAYDNVTGNLYFSDGGNCRIRVIDTTQTVISVGSVAGNGTCGFSGDTGQATSAEVNHPMGLAVGNGKLYIGDSTNGRVRVVNLSTGVIDTLAGNGTYNDTGDGGAATSAAVETPTGLAVDLVGNVYIGTGSGLVRKVDLSGTISTIAAIQGSMNGLARDQYGNIYGTTSWYSKAYKFTNPSSVTVGTPSASVTPTTPMYKMKVSFSLSGVSCPAAASVTLPGGVITHKNLCATGETAPSSASVDVPVTSLNPETGYTVKVTIDDGNGTSPTSSGTLTTPKVPLILAIGDSITSGHHRQTPDAAMTCDDPNFGYPRYFKDAVQASLPTQWAPQYVNLAHSGFSTDQVISNGANACGNTPADVPLTKAESLLASNAGSWNRVLATAGIDDTNWGDVLGTIGGHAIDTINYPTYTAGDCTTDLQAWNGWQPDTLGQHISTNIGAIVYGLATADPAVRIDWLGYYNIAGTGSPIPASCEAAFDSALSQLAGYITGGLAGSNATFVQSDSVMDMQTSLIQAYQLPWDTAQGWPHPNSSGASAIAAAIPSS
jgi:hypothetical protein